MNVSRAARSVVLVGLMGTGKTTVAGVLARHLGVPMLDTDRLVESEMGRSVRRIFEDDGEELFREVESRVLAAVLASERPVIVATGGGAVLRQENRRALCDSRSVGRARVVWLTADVADLVERTERGANRPLLDGNRRDLLAVMESDRTRLYREVCDVAVSTSGRGPDEVADSIVRALEGLDEGTSS